MTDSLLARTARGAGWVMAWRFGMRVLGLTSTLVLVRLLVPADFGLIALASGFMQSVDGLMSLGTEEAVIRTRAPDRDTYDTAFTMTALRGLFASLLVAALAFPAAGFFGDARLGPVLLAVAVLPLLDGLSNIGAVDFRRDMTFHKEFALMVLPKLGGILTAIVMALLLRSYVAMLCGMLANRSLRMVMTYVMHPYRPRFSLRSWRALVGYSVWAWVLSLAMLVRDRSDSLILGRLTNPAALGLFGVGTEIAALPMTELVEPLGRAAFAGFASARREGAEVRETFLSLIGLSALIALPAGLGLSLIAAPLVRLTLGAGWDEAVPILQVMPVACIVMVFGHLSQHLLSAHALLARLVALTVVAAAIRVVLLLALIPAYGVMGAVVAASLAIVAEHGVLVAIAMREFGMGTSALAVRLWRPVVATGAMTAALWGAGLGWQPLGGGVVLQLLGAIGIGVPVFAATLLLVWLAAGRPAGAEADILRLIATRFRRGT